MTDFNCLYYFVHVAMIQKQIELIKSVKICIDEMNGML